MIHLPWQGGKGIAAGLLAGALLDTTLSGVRGMNDRRSKQIVKRQDILAILAERRAEIESRFNVDSLAIFGSVARDEASPDSDVDILVSYREPPGIFDFLELKEYLQDLLHCRVDLVTRNGLKRQFRDRVLQEAVDAL